MRRRPFHHGLARLAFAGAVGLACAAGAQESNENRRVDGYAALVNDRVILQSDVDMTAIPLLRNLARTLDARLREVQLANQDDPNLEEQQRITEEFNARAQEAREQALEALIERYLIVEEFERQEGELPDRVINDHIQRIIDDRFEGDRSKLVDSLRQEQITFDEFKEQRREDLISTLLRQQELRNLPSVSPQEVLALYESRLERYRQPAEVKLSGITLSLGETEEERDTKRLLAEGLRRRLLDGEDFASVARAHSEGRRAEEGGEWGWRVPSDLRPEMAKAIEQTPTGQISEIVEMATEQGDWLYILRVEARKESTLIPFEQVRDDLRAELEETAREETYRAWIERLKTHHYVKIF